MSQKTGGAPEGRCWRLIGASGDAFSLADVAWLPLQFTLDLLAGYSFDSYDNIAKWAKRIESRPSFQKSVVDWFPPEMLGSK